MNGPENRGFSPSEEEDIPFAEEVKPEEEVNVDDWLEKNKSGNSGKSDSTERGNRSNSGFGDTYNPNEGNKA